jgi:hypothetical protein
LRFTSHLRNTLARMAREGRLRKVEGYGYWLPGRELPPNLDV